jgi:ABC-2 type transport system permease protein
MRNVFTVLSSEFGRRVRSKGFILATLLTPFGFLALIAAGAGVGFLMAKTDTQTVAVDDRTGLLYEHIESELGSNVTPTLVSLPDDTLSAAVLDGRYNMAVVLPASLVDGEGEIRFYTSTGGGNLTREHITREVRSAIEDVRLDRAGADPVVREIVGARLGSSVVRVSDEGAEEESSAFGGAALGGVMGFLIYLSVFIYGSMVMQSVIEEKTSRVVEVMVSAVKPFDLLLGKVLGIGLLGVVQQVTWLAIILGGAAALGPILAAFAPAPDPAALAAEAGAPADAVAAAQAATPDIPSFLPDIGLGIVVAFVLFFIGGYLIYSSLFAAAGSAVEEVQDAQSFTVPIMIPVILGFVSMTPILESPDSSFAVVMSLIPFFSPMLMLARMAITEVPFWQVAASLVLLFGGFLATMWLSARIYRVGILSYGKKPSYGDLVKWIRAS